MIEALMEELVKGGGSDLHLATGQPPYGRFSGELRPMGDEPLTEEQCNKLIFSMLNNSQRKTLEQTWELDCAYGLKGVARIPRECVSAKGKLCRLPSCPRQLNPNGGHGLSATALQLAQAYSVLADDGIRKPVSLLKLSAEDAEMVSREQVLSSEIVMDVKAMLGTVVDESRGGSVLAANVPFYSVAGKSGTAHVVGEQGYEENLHNSLFVGMVPASDPEIVIVVIINEPKGDEHYGGQVAAPVFSKVASGAMRILKISPDVVPENQILELTSL